jgi:hypothetical protein
MTDKASYSLGSAQEVFDQVIAHARTQKVKAQRGGDLDSLRCMYRTPGGLKCFVGALIPDAHYEPKLDEKGYVVADLIGLFNFEYLKPHERLLVDLQNVHDDWQPKEWEDRFQIVAGRHGLTYTPPAA